MGAVIWDAFDGKGMQVSHHLDGCKCWVCPCNTADPQAMTLCRESPPNKCKVFSQSTFMGIRQSTLHLTLDRNVRYGAFLRHMPLERLVGDFAHEW